MKQELDMVTVRKYVDACDSRGWRPVFTHEQFKLIWNETLNGPWPMSADHPSTGVCLWTLFGVQITINNTPRPPMPAELLARW